MGTCRSKLYNTSSKSIPTNIDPSKIKPFVPPITGGRVIKCYDGDTITIASGLPYKGSELYKFSVRINGIDCPEIRSKNENEKKCAYIAKKKVEDLLLNKMIILEDVKTEKYGRLLADVIINNISVGPWLLEQNLAVKYEGKTKTPPEDWMDYYNKNLTNIGNTNIGLKS